MISTFDLFVSCVITGILSILIYVNIPMKISDYKIDKKKISK